MRTDETPFEQALRVTRENETRIRQQRALIARLEGLHQPQALAEAKRVLGTMQSNQRIFSARLRMAFDTTA